MMKPPTNNNTTNNSTTGVPDAAALVSSARRRRRLVGAVVAATIVLVSGAAIAARSAPDEPDRPAAPAAGTEAPGDDAVSPAPTTDAAATNPTPVSTTPTDPDPTTTAASAGPAPLGNGDGTADLDGSWSTRGADIVDADGDVVQIRGVNWFGFETGAGMPHGLWSRNMEEMLDQIAGLGFNTIRLPFSSAMLADGALPQGMSEQANPELVGLSSLELMDRFIDAAGVRGLAIILDRHALGPDDRASLWYDDQYPQERLAEDWQLLATRYADRVNVIGADLYNEPHDQACWGCGDPAFDWKAAAESAGDAVHAIEPEWLIFVEGVEQIDGASCDGPEATSCTWWGANLSGADAEPIRLAAESKVVYSPHEYATSVFRQAWFDDPSFPENMPAIWGQFWGDLETSDTAPVMVGEFGSKLEADIDRVWLGELLAYLDEIDAGFTFWSFNPNSGDTGGILEDDWTTVDADKMSYLEPYLPGPFEPIAVPVPGGD
jgi:endoglucanase